MTIKRSIMLFMYRLNMWISKDNMDIFKPALVVPVGDSFSCGRSPKIASFSPFNTRQPEQVPFSSKPDFSKLLNLLLTSVLLEEFRFGRCCSPDHPHNWDQYDWICGCFVCYNHAVLEWWSVCLPVSLWCVSPAGCCVNDLLWWRKNNMPPHQWLAHFPSPLGQYLNLAAGRSSQHHD